ncbi:MAG: metal ABC transporter permease [Deltaproteobacteria bacterium]|jgi:zinc transport system permease protein|nr:metal ABC transporter permease [Deltaproteobacteria bacterium]
MLENIYGFMGLFYESGFMQRAAFALFLLSFAASGTGVLVVSRRMAFFPDAAGHTIFGGLALGLIFGLPVDIVVLVFGVLIGLLIIYVVRHSTLASDTVIGLIFSGGVAFGLALVSRYPEAQSKINRYFLGDIMTVNDNEIVLLIILAIVSLLFFIFLYNRLMLSCVSPANYLKSAAPEYLFGAFLAFVVVISVQVVGVLLVTALLIAPAAAGRILAPTGRWMFWIALAVSLVSGQLGLLIAYQPQVNTTPGATVVFISIVIFALSVLGKRLYAAFTKKELIVNQTGSGVERA